MMRMMRLFVTRRVYLRLKSWAILYFLLPTLFGCLSQPQKIIIQHTVSRGETLLESLIENGIQPKAAGLLIKELSKVFNPKYSCVNDYYEVVASTDGIPLKFLYYPRGEVYYEVVLEFVAAGLPSRKEMANSNSLATSHHKFTAFKKELPTKQTTRKIKGKIDSSLWEAMSEQNLEPELIVRFAEIFESQIDFLTEPRKGDEYKVIWEEKEIKTKNFEKKIIGKILGAQYIKAEGRGQRAESGRQKTEDRNPSSVICHPSSAFTAIGYGNDELDYDYYSPDGKSLRLAFLKAPLSFRRISSFFSKRRKHPILKIYRPHHGIDYVAPYGTPVSSIGSGVVIFKGCSGGLGNTVKVKHPNGYTSVYGHLSKFGKIKKGAKVNKGQIIGYVGSTGLSTGPHLHFEIRLGKKPLNFLKLKLPSTKTIPKKFEEDFKQTSAKVIAELRKL